MRSTPRTCAASASTTYGWEDPERVADVLSGLRGGQFVVVNATEYADLEVVVLGLLAAEDAGTSFVCRVGPSFPGVLAGLAPRAPLTSADLWPNGRPSGHGLVVVGSHVGLTSRQIDRALGLGGLAETEVQVVALLSDGPGGTSPPSSPS